MPFPRETAGDPKSVGRIAFSAMNLADGSGFKLTVGIQLLNGAGAPIRVAPYDITDDITGPQTTAITNFLNSIRTRANSEIIP